MTEQPQPFPRASFFRRLAAMIYDALVATAVGMCAALVITSVMVALIENDVLDKLGHEHASQAIQASLLYTGIVQLWVGIWIVGFFLWFWKHGGQTLGMRAWRLRLFSSNDKPVTYSRLLLRMLASLGGIGTLLALVDFRSKLALQDRVSKMEVLSLSKQANDHKNW
ncbi:RDD family protein [Aestuariibacter salexigens]|uniref:RDD family protein n=1 Tax=Aestuariibacter salexigens TaxID=226010 RepID=UPI00047ACE72|nr:RDD family protein [Aestuariibacter salexigens]